MFVRVCVCLREAGESPPRWFLVMEGKGKTNKQLQEDGGVTGRVESLTQPGTFVEVRRGRGIFTTGIPAPLSPACGGDDDDGEEEDQERFM